MQRQRNPRGITYTYPSEDWWRNIKIRTNKTTLIGQWECGVRVVEPGRSLAWTPRTEDDKQGIHGTNGFRVCASAQPRQLHANHGKHPRTSTRK